MTRKIRLSDLASIAEIAASVGVILSLIFVGLQMRDSNREPRAATVQSALESELFLIATIADHAGTWDKVLSGESLASGEEARTGIVLYNMIMTEGENRYYQFNEGYLDLQTWESRLASLRPLVRLPMYESWKRTPGALNHSADFLTLLDTMAHDTED